MITLEERFHSFLLFFINIFVCHAILIFFLLFAAELLKDAEVSIVAIILYNNGVVERIRNVSVLNHLWIRFILVTNIKCNLDLLAKDCPSSFLSKSEYQVVSICSSQWGSDFDLEFG